MGIYTCPFEGTPGAALSVSNAGAVPDLDGAVTAANIIFQDDQAAHGTTSVKASTGSQQVWFQTVGAPREALIRGAVRFAANPAGDTTIGVIYHSSGAKAAQIIATSTGIIRLQTIGSGSTTNRASSPAGTLVLNGFMRYVLYVDAGTSAVTGAARLAVYSGDSTTPLWDSTLISGIDTAGTTGSLYQGRQQINTMFHTDDFMMRDGADAVWGAYPVANSLPSITTKPNDQDATAGATVNLTYGATDSDGTVNASTGWSHSVVSARSTASPSITGSTTSTPSLTAPSAGNVVQIESTATDNVGGVSTPVTVDLRVPKSGALTTLALSPIDSSGTWTNTGGATNVGAALADSNDSHYVASPSVTGSVQYLEVEVEPSTIRSDGTVTVRLDKSDSGPLTLNVKLYERYNGVNTLRKTWSGVTVTTSIANVDLTIDGTTISNLTSWSRLILRFEVTT